MHVPCRGIIINVFGYIGLGLNKVLKIQAKDTLCHTLAQNVQSLKNIIRRP